MRGKLKDRARGIDLSADEEAGEAVQPEGRTARTGSGLVIDSIVMGHEMAEELEQLKGKVRTLEERSSIQMLDPKSIKRSRWANRHEASFKTKAFYELKEEIESAGKNIVPIKVREAQVDGFEYEVVYGHRRHQACLELGLKVAATVVDATDAELFEEMDRENRTREDLSPFEQGSMYKLALESGLYGSQRELAEACGVSHTYVQLTVRMASLPEFVLKAFSSPVAIQFRWLALIEERLKSDPDGVKKDALTAVGKSDAEVLKILSGALGGVGGAKDAERLMRGGKEVGRLKLLPGNGIQIQFKKGALSQDQLNALVEAAKGLL